jgi:hypothetical protein
MKTIILFVPLLLLSACASKKPVIVNMPPSVPGTTLSSDDLESVRYGENVKAYSVGRYIDPNDGLVMHEAHTVYRIETTAKWNLHPDPAVTVPMGPVVGIIDPARCESPITAEVVAEVNRQKAATQALLEQGTRLNTALNQLSQSVPVTKQISDDNVQLKIAVHATQQRLETLEDAFRQKQAEAEFTTPSGPPKQGTNDW